MGSKDAPPSCRGHQLASGRGILQPSSTKDTPGLGRSGRCHLHSLGTSLVLWSLERPRPAGIPGSRLGGSAGWVCVLRDEAELWDILPVGWLCGLFAEGDKGWRGLGRTWGRGSCATP